MSVTSGCDLQETGNINIEKGDSFQISSVFLRVAPFFNCLSVFEFFDKRSDFFVFAVAEEVFVEMFTGKCAFDQFRIQIAQDVLERTECRGTDRVEDLLVALLGNDTFFRIAAAEGFAEQFFRKCIRGSDLRPSRNRGRTELRWRCRH